jgi:mRNA interferase MazF
MDALRRGDLVTVALAGDLGKPRPALVIQADQFQRLPAVTLLPVTSKLENAPLLRVPIYPDEQNGLSRTSHVMIDKAVTQPLRKIGRVIGHLSDTAMLEVNRSLAVFLGIA